MPIKIVPTDAGTQVDTFKELKKKGSGRTVSDADVKQIMKEFNLNKKEAKAFAESLMRAERAEEGESEIMKGKQSGGMVGKADMSAKKTSAPKKKKMPQYYMGGGTIKKGKPYSYGGRVAKYKE
jgi:polyhydroxyalkanoate synthesis regulator phasin